MAIAACWSSVVSKNMNAAPLLKAQGLDEEYRLLADFNGVVLAGHPSRLGVQFVTWRSAKVAYILRNERYIGDCRYQKTYRDTTVPFKQYANRGQEDQFYAKGTHAPLIDQDTFGKVQALLQKRQENFSKVATQNIYPLTSRIQCSECGSYFRRRLVSGTVKWACCRHINDRNACESSYYSEERIYDGFTAMVNKLRFGEEDILGQVISRLESAVLLYKKNNTAAREMSQSIAELNAKLLMGKSRPRAGTALHIGCAGVKARNLLQKWQHLSGKAL